MKRLVLDTNSYSFLFKGDVVVEQELSSADRVLVSVITLGELYLGFSEGEKEKENLSDLSKFLRKRSVSVIEINKDTSVIYAKIKYYLRRKGIPIPDNDIWIAASAIETKAILITFDRHFLKVPSLKIWKELKQ